ncbi:hypothetical protein [Polyangium spumosum]|uniref:Lipoprotein n=1 Tax=Polyangium spumosum TaxID=889282 RepID=A0A6N7PTG6_9BACT|nr:hypothetical protein [Polyangium spumosum]MRG95348.1 hypothetical protein [Polyangium spumosum]
MKTKASIHGLAALAALLACACGTEPLDRRSLACSNVAVNQDYHPVKGKLDVMMKEGPPPSEQWLLAAQTTYGAKVNGCALFEGVERWTISLDFVLQSDITSETKVNSEGIEPPYFIGAVSIRDAKSQPQELFTFGGILTPGGEVLVQEYSREDRRLRATARGYFDFDIDVTWTEEALTEED